MNKLMLLAITSIFLIGLVNAVSNDDISYYYKHGTPFNVTRECFYNGAYCNVSAFSCYLTIFSSNQTTPIVNNTLMTGTPNYYFVEIPYTDWPNGVYRCSISCSDGINSGSEIFYFMINQTGDNRSDSLFLILALGSVIILCIAFLFRNGYIGFSAGALFIVTGIYVMIFGFSSLNNMYTQAISYIFLGMGLMFTIASGYQIAQETNLFENAGGIDYEWE